MIELIWEMIIHEEARSQFELVFGPGGAWNKVFGKSEGYRGTTMLNDTHQPNRYLIMDIWDTEIQRDQAIDSRADDYAKLNTDLEGWAESQIEVGVFRLRGEATVRPSPKSNRRNRRLSR